jgi:hypothetical protein
MEHGVAKARLSVDLSLAALAGELPKNLLKVRD